MNFTKNINISNLINNTNNYINKLLAVEEEWLDEITLDEQNLADFYTRICQQHAVDNKWVLMVSPDENQLAHLSKHSQLDTSKVLKINANKVNVNIEKIISTLKKGNCAAVILPNTLLEDKHLEQLYKSAQLGRTQCIIVNKKTLH